jgi:hypothetical protein
VTLEPASRFRLLQPEAIKVCERGRAEQGLDGIVERMARPAGFEPAASGFEAQHSIRLS